MFAGGRRRSSNNVRAMQLFHELKQQFPTIPDHVVSACIANGEDDDQGPADRVLREVLEAAATLQQELMGRNPNDTTPSPPPKHNNNNNNNSDKSVGASGEQAPNNLTPNNQVVSFGKPWRNIDRAQNNLGFVKEVNTCKVHGKGEAALIKNNLEPSRNTPQRTRSEMSQVESDANRNVVEKQEVFEAKKVPPKRPDTLEIRSEVVEGEPSPRIRQSEKCKDVHKLLHSSASKPPKSPQAPKRIAPKPNQKSNLAMTSSDFSENQSETKKTDTREVIQKPLTVETPTQTTNTLLTPSQPSVNVSLNVNCSMDVVRPKHTAALHVVPQQPWCQELTSPRSYTSVNLTLRPPSSEPQAPIDITSRNSSLTYSTSTFDSQKGLQSKLQITVSPTGGSVSSVRTRPRSFHADAGGREALQAARMGSLQDLTMANIITSALASPVLMRQQARIDRLRIELRSERTRLVAVQSEVVRLERSKQDTIVSDRTDAELEKQLLREIRHLRGQCARLTVEVDRQTENGVPLGETSEEFYRNIYMGQRGPPDFGRPLDQRQLTASGEDRGRPQHIENFGPRWSCPLCTFQNHPLLDKCEQCDMARIVHGTPQNGGGSAPSDKASRTLSDLLSMQASLDTSNAVSAANSLLQYVTGSPEFVRRHSAPERRNNGAVGGVERRNNGTAGGVERLPDADSTA